MPQTQVAEIHTHMFINKNYGHFLGPQMERSDKKTTSVYIYIYTLYESYGSPGWEFQDSRGSEFGTPRSRSDPHPKMTKPVVPMIIIIYLPSLRQASSRYQKKREIYLVNHHKKTSGKKSTHTSPELLFFLWKKKHGWLKKKTWFQGATKQSSAPPWAQSCDVLGARKRHSHLPKANRGWFSRWSSTSSLNQKIYLARHYPLPVCRAPHLVPDDSCEDMMISITNGVSNNATKTNIKKTPSPSGIVAVGLGSSLWKDLQPWYMYIYIYVHIHHKDTWFQTKTMQKHQHIPSEIKSFLKHQQHVSSKVTPM